MQYPPYNEQKRHRKQATKEKKPKRLQVPEKKPYVYDEG